MPRIFISYRRNDSAGHAGRLYDRLRAHLGAERVFMDVTGIEAGTDFVETIDAAVGSCDVLIAVIGPEWARCTDSAGHHRLELPNDFIRLEVGSALKRKVRVVPVLVEGALMPAQDDLPVELHALTRRQAVELRDSRWDADVEDLIATLERIPETPASAPALPIPSPPRSDPSSPVPTPVRSEPGNNPTATPTAKSALPWAAGIGALLAVVLLGFWMSQRDGRHPPGPPANAPVPVAAPGKDVSAPVAESGSPMTGGKITRDARDDTPAATAKATLKKPASRESGNIKPRLPRAADQIQPRPQTAEATAAPPEALAGPEPAIKPPQIKPLPTPRSAHTEKRITVVAWGKTTAKGFWNGLQAQAYSERMAALLAAVLRERLPAGMEVHHSAAEDSARKITRMHAGDQVKNLCQETRATWVFAAHMEEPFAISPAESAFWPELHLAAARCAAPEPFVLKETLAPRQGEDFPFANDMRAAIQRLVREQGSLDR